MPVLTRDEAQTRAQLIDVHRYTVELDLTRAADPACETFASHTAIRFSARADGATFVELKPATLRSATLDGQPLDTTALDGNRLTLDGLTPGEHELRVDATMRYSHTGEGMHRFTDPSDGETYLYTQLFMEDVQRVFAAFDQPDLKAVFEVTVTAPESWTVLANGVTEHLGGGKWRAAPTPRVSTYLVAVAAGPWHSVRTEHRGLPFGLHCRRSLAPFLEADADELLDITRACFDRFHDTFDEPYPFDSYDQAFVPEFNAGAMENPGLVTFRDEYVFRSAVTDTERRSRAVTIAHEMAHMWFGDLVTLRWWDDIWLNESFAEYMGYQITAEATLPRALNSVRAGDTPSTDPWTDFAIARKAWGYDADQRPSTHPVAPDPDAVPDTASALLNFDGISYAKGASALRQLVTWLGEKDFLAGINTHFARHKFSNATLADFIDSLAHATDRDVHSWAAAWLRTTGVDTLTSKVNHAGRQWTLDIDRDGGRTDGRPHRVTVGVYDRDLAGGPALVLRERFETDVPATTTVERDGGCPALVVPNDQDVTYAKIRLDAASQETALASLSRVPDPLTRAVLWNSLRDMVRDGELAPARYLRAAQTHLPEESDLAVVQGVLTFATTHIAGRYTGPDERPAALATLGELCRDLIRRTEDGSHPGLRLTAVRGAINVATQPAPLEAWLTEGTVPGGPELDPELRWHILARLAVLDATDEAAITAELARDPSATGQEGAARCRAALPDAAAKQAAWEAMFATDDLSNYLLKATAQGFWQPEQADFVREYVPRYYEDAVAVAARRGPAIAAVIGGFAFPAPLVDTETLRLGERCLRDTDPTPALRRRLTDQLDDLARALRVREGDGTA
ncbi:aminopeptidase N [Streptomyces alfalfae]|uniref:Aminopeptidase N n=1 Tax=Streptomyces alfalfae TaxID=1642299 RepID=A0ABN4VSI6_9ACTN|nr:aminopeptidase N [Streptomyces alfalfae]APY88825.1 aminopeptidase N [Streptomyces alfalfae]AYA19240.1 aminopeptidase N [Streptomyces fradiae]RXX36065.1 aminopeptidase N [Streptomyces alfalfae]RZN00365.1 aminopeptidase N [Streptomyces alfalfae]